MTQLLVNSPVEGAIAGCFAGAVFFFLQWVLQTPKLYEMQRRIFTARRKLSQDTLDGLVQGVIIRIVAFIHNTLQVPLALILLADERMWHDMFYFQSALSQLVMILAAGFFLWDTLVCVFGVNDEGPAFILHGALCLMFYMYTVITGHFHFYGCGYILWELSTPFVQFRWVLYKMGLDKTQIYLINGMLMMVGFFGCRILWGTYITGHYFIMSMRHVSSGSTEISLVTIWAFRTVALASNGLNYYWFYKMMQFLYKFATGKRGGKKVEDEKAG